jgi:hypothetical protein
MFDLNQFLTDIVVEEDDEKLVRAKEIVILTELNCEDAWLARGEHYGSAGAMERQLIYLGEDLLPSAERKLQRMASKGVIGESYTQDTWFGTSNADDPHINDEIAFDQQLEDQQNFVDGLKNRMRTAAIIFVTRVRAHDDISKILDQLTYGGIKARAEQNRQAKAKAATG